MNIKINTSRIIWFFAAACFIVSGVRSHNVTYIVLGCAFICIACTKKFSEMNKENISKNNKTDKEENNNIMNENKGKK